MFPFMAPTLVDLAARLKDFVAVAVFHSQSVLRIMSELIFAPAIRRGSPCYVRLAPGSTTEMYQSSADSRVCVKYKLTPKANEYWCQAEEVLLKPLDEVEDDEPHGRTTRRSSRRKRSRDEDEEQEEPTNTDNTQDPEETGPRPASNGHTYGVMAPDEKRKPFAKDRKVNVNICKACSENLTTQPYILFIQRPSQKTVRRSYGDLGESKWSTTSISQIREFFCPGTDCWKVPKSAQQSLRGPIDITGLPLVGDEEKQSDFLKDRLPFLPNDDADET